VQPDPNPKLANIAYGPADGIAAHRVLLHENPE